MYLRVIIGANLWWGNSADIHTSLLFNTLPLSVKTLKNLRFGAALRAKVFKDQRVLAGLLRFARNAGGEVLIVTIYGSGVKSTFYRWMLSNCTKSCFTQRHRGAEKTKIHWKLVFSL